ncbi:MAG: hypothetical protein AAFV93_24050 [Chloroflexota bacterium]
MLEIFIAIILLGFFGLFLLMAMPLKDQAKQLNNQMDSQPSESSYR